MYLLVLISLLLACGSYETPGVAKDSFTVVSWNTKHLGRKTFDNTRAVKMLLSESPDLIMLQEVNTNESGKVALDLMTNSLNASGKKYCQALSFIPSDSRERYAMLWNSEVLQYVTTKGEVIEGCPRFAVTLPLLNKKAEKIVREPSFAVFMQKTTKKKFLVSTVHLVPTAKNPEEEIPFLAESFPGKGEMFANLPMLIAGDFNLELRHPSYRSFFNNGFVSVLPKGLKTSLKMKQKAYNEEYDQMLVKNLNCKNGRGTDMYAIFPELTEKETYYTLSDHRPIVADCN
jgi:endonuclease/exonuclease/phosphatase family metal-dependent hydrolase